MKTLISILLLAIAVRLGNGFSKYGRTCKDIGCLSNEQCTMAEDPCSYYNRDECGMYPTCQKVSSAAATCATFVCPPTKTCRMDGSTPKCVDDDRASSSNTFSNNNPLPSDGNGNGNGYHPPPPIYPQIPGQTTTRAPAYRPNGGYPSSGGGYQGGQIGSGYPGSGGYPAQNGGYPNYPGYPSNGGYPSGGSGGYPAGYPSQGGSGSRYPSSGYPSSSGGSGYPSYNSGGYGGYNYNSKVNQNNPYGSGGVTTSNPLLDGLKNTLKAYGKDILANVLKNVGK